MAITYDQSMDAMSFRPRRIRSPTAPAEATSADPLPSSVGRVPPDEGIVGQPGNQGTTLSVLLFQKEEKEEKQKMGGNEKAVG